ncbi:hypothetical protein Sfulv_50260 [Streptomyces fulvorobeus]|uniref:Uncharacterized protein n=1 Tax=Streptomyces fulvorobeus TaxID=284028 RepID=A0A7J0CCG2_9ACTN|nr:hypothetical protein [Streptomyces fulvorobeus]GFN00216.1 hypothetical protein Sfulv_50260 [Streptomyces fulvorobeus]
MRRRISATDSGIRPPLFSLLREQLHQRGVRTALLGDDGLGIVPLMRYHHSLCAQTGVAPHRSRAGTVAHREGKDAPACARVLVLFGLFGPGRRPHASGYGGSAETVSDTSLTQ